MDSSGDVVESICSDILPGMRNTDELVNELDKNQLGKSPDNKPGGRKVDEVGDKKGLKKSKSIELL